MNASLSSVIYGPVPSWRLGRSLGVDMVLQQAKTCRSNCAYCQLGPTRIRRPWHQEHLTNAARR